jgi:signal transduction histidine kinase
MTLANRNLLSFSAAMLLAGTAGAYSIYTFDQANRMSAELQRIANVVHAADRAEAEGLEASLMLQQYINTADTAALIGFAASRVRGAEARRTMREQTRLPRVRELLDRYEALLPERVALAEEIIAHVRAGDPPASWAEDVRARELLAAQARPYLAAIVSLQQATAAAALASARERSARFRSRALDLTGLTIVLIGVISLLTSRRISRRLLPLLGMAHEVRRGNFKARVPVRDSDEIATLSDAFNHMAADLQQLDAAKDEFVALASHQLRTPAAAVKANLSALLDGYFGELPAEPREIVADAFGSNERQLHIIEDLLAVARVETGRLLLSKGDTDLAALVDEVVGEHRVLVQQRNQALTVVRPEGRVAITADKSKLKMALDNLVSNASKYTPCGGEIVVRLDCRPTRVELSVQDTGIGIAREDQDKLFRKFARLQHPATEEIGGTGLGLYLAHEIVRLHGGEVSVESTLGKGSTFSVSLPRA